MKTVPASLLLTLQELLDALPAEIALIDREGTLLLTNRQWSEQADEVRQQPGDTFAGLGTDDLTGAATRRRFHEQAERTLQQEQTAGSTFSIIYLDLDDFKGVNDRYGHAVGDILLKLVCTRVQHMLRQGDLLARFGGDEFVLLLPGISSLATASVLARLRQLLEASFVIDDQVVLVTVSLGAASYPEQGSTVDALLRHADDAMYRSKSRTLRDT